LLLFFISFKNNNKINYLNLIYSFSKQIKWGLGIGDWGLGIGDWGVGPIPNPQSPIPNPQSPIPNPQFCKGIKIIIFYFKIYIIIIMELINIILNF